MADSINTRTPAYWGDIFIDFVIGVVVLMLEPRWLVWAWSTITHRPFDFVDANGNAYPQSWEFWMDFGPALFGVSLIVVSGLMCFRRRGAVIGGFALTVMSILFNAIYVIVTYASHGPAIISIAAAVFGVFLAIRQWQMIMPKPAVL